MTENITENSGSSSDKTDDKTKELEAALAGREVSPIGTGPLRQEVKIKDDVPTVSPGTKEVVQEDKKLSTTITQVDKKPIDKASITVLPKKEGLDLKASMERQITDYWTGPTWPKFAELKKTVNYIFHSDGIWMVRQNSSGIYCIKHQDGKFPGFSKKEVKPFFWPRFGKIPFGLLQQIVYFFKDICDESKSEVYTQIFWNPAPDDGSAPHYYVNVPEQDVSSGRVEYKRDVDLEKKHVLVCEIHSHNTMGAFFSSVDDADEKNDRFYGVVGELDRQHPAITMSYVCGGKRTIFNYKQLFTEAPTEEQLFPQEWKKGVTRSSASVHAGGFGQDHEAYWNEYGRGSGGTNTRDNRSYRHEPVRGFPGSGNGTYQGAAANATASGIYGGTPEQRVEEAFRQAQETLDPKSIIPAVDILANNVSTAESKGDSANPFFSDANHGILDNDGDHDEALSVIVGTIIETILAHHVRGTKMTNQDKSELFKSFVAGLKPEDVSILLDIVKQHGHEDLMMSSLNMMDPEELKQPLTVDSAL